MASSAARPVGGRAGLLVPLGIGGALVAAALWATQASTVSLMLLAATGAAVAFARWPALGLMVVIVTVFPVPLALDTGGYTKLNLAVLMVALLTGLWGLDMLRRRNLRLLPSAPVVALLVFMAVAVAAAVAGAQPWLAFGEMAPAMAQLSGLAIFLLSACAFLLVAHQVRDVRTLQALVWVFLVVGAVSSRAVGLLTGPQTVGTPFAPLGSVFFVWLVSLALSQAIYNRSLAVPWRLGLVGLVLWTFYVALVLRSDWASGWLPPLVAVAVTLFAGSPRLGVLALLVGSALAAANWADVAQVVMSPDNEYSLSTRLEAWRLMLEIMAVNPVLGLGFANYHWYTPLFPILGYSVQFNSHNNYVDIVAQTGLVGLASFLWFALAVGWLGWRLRTLVPPGFPRAYVYGATGGLAGMLAAGMLGDWVLPFVYNVGFAGFPVSVVGWMFLGGLVALEQMARRAGVPGHTAAVGRPVDSNG